MQVYKTFAKIAKKKFSNTITYFVVFFVLLIAFSFQADSTSDKQFRVSSVDMCIIDQDESTASKALCDYLTSIHNRITLDSYDRETLQDNLYYQQIDYVLTIPSGFEGNLKSGDFKDLVESSKRGDSASGYFVDRQIDAFLNSIASYLSSGFTLDDAIRGTNHSLESVPSVDGVHFADTAKSEDSLMYYFFQYFPYIALMMLLCGLSPVLMEFHKENLSARIRCSALADTRIAAQIGLSCFVYVVILWLAFIVIAACLAGPAQLFSTSGLLGLLNSFVYILIAASIALLLGAFSIDFNIVNMIANILGLGMSFLSGIFVPQYARRKSVDDRSFSSGLLECPYRQYARPLCRRCAFHAHVLDVYRNPIVILPCAFYHVSGRRAPARTLTSCSLVSSRKNSPYPASVRTSGSFSFTRVARKIGEPNIFYFTCSTFFRADAYGNPFRFTCIL